MKILVTGAEGFIGQHMLPVLKANGFDIRCAVRDKRNNRLLENSKVSELVELGDIGTSNCLDEAVQGVDAIVHLAGKAHAAKDKRSRPYEQTNTEGTIRLAKAAARLGVSRFVYVSSIKVNGDVSGETPFDETHAVDPTGIYAVSKWRAENALKEISRQTSMEIVIVRPTLVYGACVKGNLKRMMSFISKGFPIPVGSVESKRSYIDVRNLSDLLAKCVTVSSAAGELFLAADDGLITVETLILTMSKYMHRTARIIKIPNCILKLGARLIGKRDLYEKLNQSLVIDNTKAKILLGWRPKYSFEDTIQKMVEGFLNQQ